MKRVLITGGPTNEYIDEVMKITNMSSITYLVTTGRNPIRLLPFHSFTCSVSASSSDVALKVMNMYCSRENHPVVNLKV